MPSNSKPKFNIFSAPTKDDIRVGYIDPSIGYVSNVSICDANEYAKKNPGTTFIFETRDNIKYLNINEVNKLTPKDLASSADTCKGVEVEADLDKPDVIFSGGGGVGAAGNPVFGKDGSLLAVDLIRGGFGYQYPPQVQVKDDSGIGIGAVTRAILVGDPNYSDCAFAETEEVFDQEDDFEDYQLCDNDDPGYGKRYDPDGKVLGEWEPTLYATLTQDPIGRQIKEYQDFLQQLDTPWWSTRKEVPLSVSSPTRKSRTKYDVQHPGWGGEYGVSDNGIFKDVTMNIFTSGGGGKGLALVFTSADKSHTFKIKADDFSENKTGQKITQKVKINTVYNISSEGSFRGKGSERGLISSLGRKSKETNSVTEGSVIFADFIESSNDNDDLQVEVTLGKFTSKQIGKGGGRSTFDLKYELRDNSSYTKPAKIDDSFMNKYAISPVPPSNAPGSDFAGQEFTMEWEEEFPYDGEYVFRAQADNLGRFYLDNEKLIETTQFKADKTPNSAKKTVKAGVHRIRVDLYNEPQYEKVVVQQVKPQPSIPDQKPFQVVAAYSGVKNLVNNFKAGIYKITSTYEQDTGPTGIAIEIKNKTTGRVVFNTLQSINSSNVKLAPVTSGKYSIKEFAKNSEESKRFLQQSGVFPENVKNKSKTYIEWSNIYFNDTDDYEITASADDQIGFTISIVSGLPSNDTQQSPPQPSNQSSTQSTETKVRKIFNTIDYIDKADRKLWRLDPRAGKDSAFINQYGILPFDPNSDKAQTESFTGTHVIRWEYIDFPIDGNYNIEIMVDDNVTLYIGNREGGGAKDIGNGLRSIDQGGDEVIIVKKGFSGPGKSTGKSSETRFFKAGKYRIRAELEQINVGPLAKGNPMALAINIENSTVEKNVISARSWNENPMGAALTIDAPLPPIPQEPIPPQEGRCPNNPIWTTRFPAKQKWWPVNFTRPQTQGESWSKFMNRYAISPIPPLSKPGSDGGGIVYRNEWDFEAPYDGFYAFKSTVDNAGRILVDDVPIMQANYIPTNLANTRGGSGVLRKSGIEDINGGIIFNWRENNPKSKKIFLRKGLHKIQIEVENGKTETFTKVDKKVFSTKDWLFPPRVQTPPPQPDPTPTRTVEEWVRVDDVFIPPTFQIRDRGQVLRTIPSNASFHEANEGTWYRGRRLRERGDWNDTNPYTNYIEWDSNTRLTLGTYRPDTRFAIAVWNRRVVAGNQTPPNQTPNQTPTAKVSTAIINQSPTAAGVVYEGPTPIASYPQPITGRTEFISPVFQDINAKPNAEIQGREWLFKWSNVDFPVTGQYTLSAEADDRMIVKVDGVQVGQAKVFEGRNKTTFNATKGKKTVELILSNISIPNTGFQENPVVGFAEITVPVDVSTGKSQPWTTNPVGISAILIPPPCPKKVRGKGIVCRVIVDDPGNGFPKAPGPGYPATLRLKSVEVETTGINYSCGVDQIKITPDNGAKLGYECDTFGRITKVNVLSPGLGFNTYPEISIPSLTGVNARFRPQFEVVRDPIVVDPQVIIQVTDLVGLKQTGYVDGRPYYGAVFYQNGIRYAGFYQTPGQLVQVYNTLQESIDAQVTTPPSAILRQGTDITSNDPRLNIPGTPDEIV